jgi:hypothetical protein
MLKSKKEKNNNNPGGEWREYEKGTKRGKAYCEPP